MQPQRGWRRFPTLLPTPPGWPCDVWLVMEPPACCCRSSPRTIHQPVLSCAGRECPSLGLNLPPSYTNMAFAHFYCCKLFMKEMLHLETEV